MSADDKDQKKSAAAPAAGKAKDSAARTKKAKSAAAFDYRIPTDSRWAGLWKIWAGVGVVGLLLAGVGYATDPTRFAFSYLFAFICALTVALGSLFFIIIERLTSAGWSVAVRRIAEFFAGSRRWWCSSSRCSSRWGLCFRGCTTLRTREARRPSTTRPPCSTRSSRRRLPRSVIPQPPHPVLRRRAPLRGARRARGLEAPRVRALKARRTHARRDRM